MTTSLLFIISIAASSTSQYWQKRAAIDSAQKYSQPFMRKLLSTPILLAIFWLLISAIAWLGVLRDWNVSIAYPMLSLNFIIMLLIANRCFGEKIYPKQWLGSLLILLGVCLLGSSL